MATISKNLLDLINKANKSGFKPTVTKFIAWFSLENFAKVSDQDIDLEEDVKVVEVTVTPKDPGVKAFKKVEVRIPTKDGSYVAFNRVRTGGLIADVDYSSDELYAVLVEVNKRQEWQFNDTVPKELEDVEEGVMAE